MEPTKALFSSAVSQFNWNRTARALIPRAHCIMKTSAWMILGCIEIIGDFLNPSTPQKERDSEAATPL